MTNQVQPVTIKLDIKGGEQVAKLKSSFRDLTKTVGQTDAGIEAARKSINDYAKSANNSEAVIKGQIKALEGLREQAAMGGKVYSDLSNDITELKAQLNGSTSAIDAQRKSLLETAGSAKATQSQLLSVANALSALQKQTALGSKAFVELGQDIANLEGKIAKVKTEQEELNKLNLAANQAATGGAAATRLQIKAINEKIASLREEKRATEELSRQSKIRLGMQGLLDRPGDVPFRSREYIEQAVARSLLGENITKMFGAKELETAIDLVKQSVAELQNQVEVELGSSARRAFQEMARQGRESARSLAIAFSGPEFERIFANLEKNVGELPNTTAGLSQRLRELERVLNNTARGGDNYVAVALEIARVQREATATTQGLGAALVQDLASGVAVRSQRNLREAIGQLQAEMSELNTETAEGSAKYAENARQVNNLQKELDGIANSYRTVADMAQQAATAQGVYANRATSRNYFNRAAVRAQEVAGAQFAEAVRAGVASTPLMLPAAGQTTAAGTGAAISGGAVPLRGRRGPLRPIVGLPTDLGTVGGRRQRPAGIEVEVNDEARRSYISQTDAVRANTEAKEQARRVEMALRAEIKKALAANNGSIQAHQRLRAAIENYRVTLPENSKRFALMTKRIQELDAQAENTSRRMSGRRRMSPMQMTQAAGAAISGGIFGGPEGFLGGVGGALVGGVGGAFAGAAIGAQVGGLRQTLGEFADYAAGIQRLQIALKGVSDGQSEFNFAIASARDVVERLNVPQETATQGMTRLTAAVKGAGGGIPEASAAFKNITAAIIATGGGAEQVEGAITALVQIFSKGKVSMEEINQIAERLPGAFNIFADAAGKTGPELLKGLQEGEIGLNDLMSFVRELGARFESTANTIGGSSQAAGARLRVAFNDMRIAVGEALQPLGAEIQSVFADLLKDSIPALTKLANATVSTMRAIGAVLKPVASNFDLVAGSLVGLGSALAVGKVVAYSKQVGNLSAAIGLARRETVQLIKSTVAFAKLRGALALLVNPWAALAAGIVAAGVGLYRAATANDRFNQSIRAGKVDLDEASKELERLYERVNLLSVRLESQSNNRLLQSLRRQMLRARKDAENTAEAIETLIYKPYGKDFVGPVMPGMSPADEARNAFNAQKRKEEREARERKQRATSLLNAIEQRENSIAQARIQLEEQAARIRKQAIEQARQLEERFADQRLQKERQLQDLRRQLTYVKEDITLSVARSRFITGGGDPEIARIRREAVEFERRQKEKGIKLERQFLDEQTETSKAIEKFKSGNAKAIMEANEQHTKRMGEIQREYARNVAKIVEEGTGRAGKRLELAGVMIANEIKKAEAQATALQLGYSFKRGGGIVGPSFNVLSKAEKSALGAAREAFVKAEKAIDRAANSLASIPTATAIAAPAIGKIGVNVDNLTRKLEKNAAALDKQNKKIKNLKKELAGNEEVSRLVSAAENILTGLAAKRQQLERDQAIRRGVLRLREEGYSEGTARSLMEQELDTAQLLARIQALRQEAENAAGSQEELARVGDAFDAMKQNAESLANTIRDLTIALDNIPTKIKLRTAVVDLQQQLRDLVDPANQIKGAATAIGDAFSQSFVDAISGAKTAKEALANFFESVASYFLDMAKQIIAKMITMYILNQSLNLLPGLGGGPNLTTSSGVSMSAGTATQSGFDMGSSLAGMFAMGGIMTEKGPLELNRYASGGIARGPQLAVFGEGRKPEAYVPLPDGRSIPVTMEGGKVSTNVVVNVDARGTSVQGDDRSGKALGSAISAAVQAELIKQQRPGGLLAS